MNTQNTNPDKTVAAFIHLSTFSKYFIPLGNFIFPLILWTAKKQDPFVDDHGKKALNFQISMFLYFVLVAAIGISGVVIMGMNISEQGPLFFSEDSIRVGNLNTAIPLIVFMIIIGIILLGLFITDLVAVISATIKAKDGHNYKYPITINFISSTNSGDHTSKNEQFNNTQNQTL